MLVAGQCLGVCLPAINDTSRVLFSTALIKPMG